MFLEKVLFLGLVIVLGSCETVPDTSAPQTAEEQVTMADNYWANDDLDKALPLYMKAAEQETAATDLRAWALFRIGRYYDRHGDTGKAVEWYTMAADGGNSTAQFNLGNIYNRQGDNKKAFELWLKAAKQGEPQAQYNTGVFYLQGAEGVVEKDTIEALKWFDMAYKNGSTDAEKVMKQLGLIQ
jgi:TPR repeat protein